MGKDSYVVTATSHGTFGGGGTEFAEAAKTANAYCDGMGKHMIARQTDAQTSGWGQVGATATFVFSCVDEDDPEYKRLEIKG